MTTYRVRKLLLPHSNIKMSGALSFEFYFLSIITTNVVAKVEKCCESTLLVSLCYSPTASLLLESSKLPTQQFCSHGCYSFPFQLQMKFQSQNQRSFLKFCREETWITNKKGKLTLSNINTRWCCSHRYLTQQLCCTLLELSVLFHLELQLTEMKKVTGKWIMKEDRVISSQICLILGCIWIKTLNTWKVLIYFINQEQPRAFQHLKFSCIAMKIDFTDQNIFTCTKTQQSIPQKLLQKMDAKWKGKSRKSQRTVSTSINNLIWPTYVDSLFGFLCILCQLENKQPCSLPLYEVQSSLWL